MDLFIIIVASLLVLTGLLGCIMPALPGPPLSYLGLLLLHFTKQYDFSITFLTVCAAITILVSIFDYLIPIWGTKRFGGSRYGVWGSIIGLLLGFFWPPIGLLLGPLWGAVIGEMIGGQKNNALKAGFGAFIGFIGGTLLKLIASGIMLYHFVVTLVK